MSETNDPAESPSSRAYIVRLWRGHQDGRWYFSVQDVLTGDRRGFAGLDGLCGYFQGLIDEKKGGTLMPVEENKAMMRHFLEEGLFKGRLDLIDEVFAPDFVNHHPPSGRDREGLKQFLAATLAAIPDLQYTIVNLFGEGDRVAIHVRGEASHQGPLFGVPATGKKITIETMTIVRIVGGKVVERWYIPDVFGLMQQIGAMPAPVQADG
jgi:predicted ester cyclase